MAREEVIVEVAGRRIYARQNHPSGWELAGDGLDDWWNSGDAAFDTDLIPGQDGAFDPDEVLVGPRSFTIHGYHRASSREWADRHARSWLAALSKRLDLEFRVFSSGRWLSVRNAKILGRVKQREHTDTVTEFQFTVWAADPRKYGQPRTVIVEARAIPRGGLDFPIVDGSLDFGSTGEGTTFPGVFRVTNPGTAEFYPTFTVRGPISSFTITSESSVLEYTAAIPNGKDLVLSPYLGGRATLDGADVSTNLVQAGWEPVLGGQTRGYLFTPEAPGLGSQLTVDYPEGAWW